MRNIIFKKLQDLDCLLIKKKRNSKYPKMGSVKYGRSSKNKKFRMLEYYTKVF